MLFPSLAHLSSSLIKHYNPNNVRVIAHWQVNYRCRTLYFIILMRGLLISLQLEVLYNIWHLCLCNGYEYESLTGFPDCKHITWLHYWGFLAATLTCPLPRQVLGNIPRAAAAGNPIVSWSRLTVVRGAEWGLRSPEEMSTLPTLQPATWPWARGAEPGPHHPP